MDWRCGVRILGLFDAVWAILFPFFWANCACMSEQSLCLSEDDGELPNFMVSLSFPLVVNPF